MFSSNALMQIVFADPKDIYFPEGILKSDLNSYLWYKLHDKYDTVYFADRDDRGDIHVSYYLEAYTDNFRAKGFLSKSPQNTLAKWLKKQLRDKKHKSAVVFSLESFCVLFRREKEVLSEIRMSKENSEIYGTIVLVAPLNFEKSSKWLLDSHVFDYLDEISVNSLKGYRGDIYAFLKNRKQEACVFLNLYTRERIYDILNYVMLEDDSKFVNLQSVEYASDYLTQYMNNRYMQMTSKRLFTPDFNLINPAYRDFYMQLKDKSVWNELMKRSREYGGRIREKLPNHYIDENSIAFYPLYDDESVHMRCMKLCFAGAIHNAAYDEPTIDKLNKIYSEASHHKNREKNYQINEKLNKFIDELQRFCKGGDSVTCGRTVSAVLFCIKWIYADGRKQEDVMQIINAFEHYIKWSDYCYTMQKNYGSYSYQYESFKRDIEQKRNVLEQLDRVISLGILNLTVSSTEMDFSKMSGDINRIISGAENYSGSDVQKADDTPGALEKDKRRFSFDTYTNLPAGLFDPSVPD